MSLSKNKKILVLVIDIDDDIGEAGIPSPIIGYKEVLDKAVHFAIMKPQDSDVNAIFSAISIYKKLLEQGLDAEIAVLSGDRYDTVKAYMKISDLLSKLKEQIGFTHIYFVSDGASDEKIIPIISSIAPVIGIERVIVEQSRGIEETYILIGRYIKKALKEQPYARIFLGIPGLLMISIVVLSVIGLTKYTLDAILLLLGSYFFIRGFGIIDAIIRSWKKSPIVGLMYIISAGLFSYIFIISFLIIIVMGFVVEALISFLDAALLPLMIGVLLLFGGKIFSKLIEKEAHTIWRESILLIPVILFIVFLNSFSAQLRSLGNNASFSQVIMLLNNSFLRTQLILIVLISVGIAVFFIIFDLLSKRRLEQIAS